MAKSDDPNAVPKNPAGWAARWDREVAAAKQWHSDWRAEGDKAYNAYLNKNTTATDPTYAEYNLNLYSSNINTVQSMMFGQIPAVSVDRRWADPDDNVARVASEACQRLLNLDLQECGDDYSSVMRSVLQDRLIPGCGIARVKYDYTSHTDTKEAILGEDGETELAPAIEKEVIDDEWVDELYVHWNDVLWSPCRYWSEMRWIGFRTYMGRPELTKRFGNKIGKAVPLNAKSPLEETAGSKGDGEVWSKAEVWEIWDKEHRQVFWYVEGFDKVLDQQDDFLKLENFFPTPPFLISNVTTVEYRPTSDWKLARSLYREINNLEERIALLTSAVKVVGVYDRKQTDVARLVNETAENTLLPVDNWAMFAEKGGIRGVVDFMPLDAIVSALEMLQNQQQSRIQQLFQITGMSDIVRGEAGGPQPASATEQGIKAKFASVRLQAIQDEFARFATDLQKLKFEIIAKVFRPETIMAKSNLLHSLDAQDPQVIQKAIQLIKSPRVAEWRIEIKPESMAMTDYAQLQSTRTEYLKSLGFFVQSIEPFVEKFPQSTPMLMQLMQWGLAGFKGSQEVQGVIDRAVTQLERQQQQQAQNPQPQPPNPAVQVAQIRAQSDMQTAQIDAQTEQMKSNAQVQIAQAQAQADQTRAQTQMANDAASSQRDANVSSQGQKLQLLETLIKTLGQIYAAEQGDPSQLAPTAVSAEKTAEGALQ